MPNQPRRARMAMVLLTTSLAFPACRLTGEKAVLPPGQSTEHHPPPTRMERALPLLPEA